MSHIQNTQSQLEELEKEYKNKIINCNNKENVNLTEIINKINLTLQAEWRSAIHNHGTICEKEREANEYIRQMEIDIDDEIESVKINYEKELNLLNDYAKRLTLNVSTLRKRYNTIIDRLESRDVKRNDIEKEVKELYNRQSESIDKLDRFRSIIKKKEDRIGAHDINLHRLQQYILHVEKRKYVLDYKTKSLLERIEPIDQEIIRSKNNNQNMEQQLTILKQQQNDLILRENEYEVKLNESSKRLNLAKINHRSIWKIVQQQKGLINDQRQSVTYVIHLDTIKKAFEYIEINCAFDTTNTRHNTKEQLKKFIQNMCNTMQNERQTENQLEIQGFMKEWNNQRKWLLNQVREILMT
ncbi:unnamed protein product [Rotaria magnacalcarata]|uniref:Uncharacterized protein n=2 Tax=Rotaria magnacalcarata TaxID=392030 RepID=A0A8S3BX25_9BILA|nr:unnamed protein product [Rotaria magnacalcarata]